MSGQIVQVILTGICTFVSPNIANDHRPLTAVFPNAAMANPAHHVNLIISEDDYVVDTDSGWDIQYSELGKRYRIVFLDGKRIGLAGVSGTYAPGRYCRDPKEPVCLWEPPLSNKVYPTTPEELESVQWIPGLGRSWPRMFPMRSARRMRRGFFSAQEDPQLVSASFELPPGKLSSQWVSGDIWRFQPRSMTRRRFESATAQEVRFETEVASLNTMHFDLCDLETGRVCGYVRITKRDPSSQDPMLVVMANAPDADLLPGSIIFCGQCGSSECQMKNDPYPCTCVDHHYSHYYEGLTDTIPASPSLPHRIAIKHTVIPVTMRVGGDNCPPSQYP